MYARFRTVFRPISIQALANHAPVRYGAFALIAALTTVVCSGGPRSFAQEPVSAQSNLADLNPVKVRVDKDRISIESGTRFRLDDGRTVLYWRPKGQTAWVESTGGAFQDVKSAPDSHSFRVAFGELRADVTVRKFIGDRVWRFSGKLTNGGKEPVELARFHYMQGTATAGLNFLELIGLDQQVYLRSGQPKLSPSAAVSQYFKPGGINWPRLADPINNEVGWFVSIDIGALVENWRTPGWGFGFVGPGNAFGQIGYRGETAGPQVFLGVLLDNIVLEPGATFTLEEALVWCGDWQSGIDVWARATAAECGARNATSPVVGYCSWYQGGQGVSAENIERATKEFAAWPVPPGGRVIQIDDGYQVQPGDWGPNERFAKAWPGLPGRIAASGSLPGLWVAPTAVHQNHPIVKQHPDWLQRQPNGEPAVVFNNWGPTYFLELDHPKARAMIRGILQGLRAEGWKFFKLDFTHILTAERVKYDPKKTDFQTLRDLYALFREAIGPDAVLNACIAYPARYALGYADVERVGQDIPFNYPGVRHTMRLALTRTATNGVWWLGDPDCFAMRSANLDLSAEEKRLLTGTIGLFGGLFLTSDFPTQWNASEAAFVRQIWNQQGPRPPQHQYVVWDADGEPTAYRVSYDDGRSPAHRIGLYNWSDAARTVRLRLSDARLDSAGLQLAKNNSAGATLKDGAITIPNQPPHSLRIVDLQSARVP